jgi:hypothetical protein
MNNFDFLKNKNDNLYECINNLEKNINNTDFGFYTLAKSVITIVVESYYDSSFQIFSDFLNDDRLDKLRMLVESKTNEFTGNNDNRILYFNDFAVLVQRLSRVSENDSFNSRSDFLLSLYFLFKNLPNINSGDALFREYSRENDLKIFNDSELEKEWKICIHNADGRNLKNKLSYFFSTYILGNDESTFESNILLENSNHFGSIFYNETNNINEYNLFFILDPLINNILAKDVFDYLREDTANNVQNYDLREFISHNIDEQNNKITLNFFTKDLVNGPESTTFSNKKIDVKWHQFSDLSDFLEDIDDFNAKKIRDAKLTVKNHAHVNIPAEHFNTHFVVVDGESIRKLYLQAKEQGVSLFDKNVREYIKDLKVDRGIQETINNFAHNFLIYNNGLTIVANNVRENGDEIIFEKMFIVNGGQTTSILGETEQSTSLSDISVFCKIVEFDFENEEDEEFIENISINSNNQKQIKSIDYISTYSGLKKFEKYFNEIDPQVKLLIKRSQRQAKEYKDKKCVVLDTMKILQLLHSAIFRNPAVAKQTPAVLLKDFEEVKSQFDVLDLSKDNNMSFMRDLVFIYKILYMIVNKKDDDYNEWKNDYRVKAASHCLYFWIYLIVYEVAYKRKNIDIDSLNQFIIKIDEHLLNYIKEILEISLIKIEEIHLDDSLPYNTILKTKTHLQKVINKLREDARFKEILNRSTTYFKGE